MCILQFSHWNRRHGGFSTAQQLWWSPRDQPDRGCPQELAESFDLVNDTIEVEDSAGQVSTKLGSSKVSAELLLSQGFFYIIIHPFIKYMIEWLIKWVNYCIKKDYVHECMFEAWSQDLSSPVSIVLISKNRHLLWSWFTKHVHQNGKTHQDSKWPTHFAGGSQETLTEGSQQGASGLVPWGSWPEADIAMAGYHEFVGHTMAHRHRPIEWGLHPEHRHRPNQITFDVEALPFHVIWRTNVYWFKPAIHNITWKWITASSQFCLLLRLFGYCFHWQ